MPPGVFNFIPGRSAVMGDFLVDHPDIALIAFTGSVEVGMRIIERARHLGAYLQATQTAEERARSQRHSIPEAVLAETAVIDFLRA